MAKVVNDNDRQDAPKQFEIIGQSSASGCGCASASGFNDSGTGIGTITTLKPGSVTIDDQVVEVTPFDNNILDIAKRAEIKIPAPCYRNQRSKGCCSACVVEIDGEQKFACSTIPQNGMNIVVDRADLKAIRKQRLLEYKEGIKTGNPCECSSPSSDNCCG